jgi:hypothetical protein
MLEGKCSVIKRWEAKCRAIHVGRIPHKRKKERNQTTNRRKSWTLYGTYHLGKENHSSDTYTTELKIEGEDWKSDETTQPKHNIPAVKKKYSQATSIKKCHIII